ncbi:hypothetical protein GOODEAATRI_006340 [Goodea atripinnis]|uniref:Uncharacterized protein n=1 Tax=Goodea atripinnis TaxID=208336 RepID=A0ABV0NS95_9TELE
MGTILCDEVICEDTADCDDPYIPDGECCPPGKNGDDVSGLFSFNLCLLLKQLLLTWFGILLCLKVTFFLGVFKRVSPVKLVVPVSADLLALRVRPVLQEVVDLRDPRDHVVSLATQDLLDPLDLLAQLDFRDFLAPLVRREREELVESLVVLDPVVPLESVYGAPGARGFPGSDGAAGGKVSSLTRSKIFTNSWIQKWTPPA